MTIYILTSSLLFLMMTKVKGAVIRLPQSLFSSIQEEALHGRFRIHTTHVAPWGREVLPDQSRGVWAAKPMEGKFSAAGMGIIHFCQESSISMSLLWAYVCHFQYKGAHVKPGFAEHFYSNPARYKGRDNMFVSHGCASCFYPLFLLNTSSWCCTGIFFSITTPSKTHWEEVRSHTLMAWSLSTLASTQMSGSTLSRPSQWLELVRV